MCESSSVRTPNLVIESRTPSVQHESPAQAQRQSSRRNRGVPPVRYRDVLSFIYEGWNCSWLCLIFIISCIQIWSCRLYARPQWRLQRLMHLHASALASETAMFVQRCYFSLVILIYYFVCYFLLVEVNVMNINNCHRFRLYYSLPSKYCLLCYLMLISNLLLVLPYYRLLTLCSFLTE